MMGIGLGVTVVHSCSGTLLNVSQSLDLISTSSKLLLGDRKTQRCCRSLERIQSSVTQCSTSAFSQVSFGTPWGNVQQRAGRNRKFRRATKGAQPTVDYGSASVPVEVEEKQEEVLLWLAPNNRQSRGRPGETDFDMKSQEPSSTAEDLVPGNVKSGSKETLGDGPTNVEIEPDPQIHMESWKVKAQRTTSSRDDREPDTALAAKEGDIDIEKPCGAGWRGLGIGAGSEGRQSAVSKACLLKKPRRDMRAARQRVDNVNCSALSLVDASKPEGREQGVTSDTTDTYLQDSLFKSFASPENANQKRSAVEKYFGDELRGKRTVERSDIMPRSPAISEGGDRLKINLDLQLYRARTLRQKGKLIEAEAILTKCIRNWPDDGRPYVALGRLLVKQNKIQEARAAYESGCQAVRGENAYIWQAWAILEEKSGNVAKARQLFDAATVADKKHAAAWHGWAKLELRADNLKRARSLLNKGLRYCGANEYLLQTLALIESRAGKLEQARSLLARATQHNPKSAASWLAWALMESQNGLFETARRLFQKGIVASPKNRYVWQAWALFEARQGNRERARELFQRGHELNPKDAVLLQAFALFEYECGRPGLARDYFRRALVCDPSHQPVWIAWGWMEWKQGNISVARELYQGAIQADSRSMDAARGFQAWGVLEDREGDSGLARELFKCALKIDSQNVPTWMSWAAMEEREGRSVRADEIRNLFLQQRTEVVDEVPWDVDLSDMLAPAIDKIKGFFKVDQRPPWSRRQDDDLDFEDDIVTRSLNVPDGRTGTGPLSPLGDEEFDVELFLKEKFPWKYGSRELLKSTAVLEAIDRSLKRQSRDSGRDERLDIFMNNEGSRNWK